MRTISLITLILTIILGLSCQMNKSNRKIEVNGSDFSIKTTSTDKINSQKYGDQYTTESTYVSELHKDSLANIMNIYSVYIKIYGFQKDIIDTLKQKDFEKVLPNSSTIKPDKITKIKLKEMIVTPDTETIKLKYQLDNSDYRHFIEYDLHISESIILNKQLNYLKSTKYKDTSTLEIEVH